MRSYRKIPKTRPEVNISDETGSESMLIWACFWGFLVMIWASLGVLVMFFGFKFDWTWWSEMSPTWSWWCTVTAQPMTPPGPWYVTRYPALLGLWPGTCPWPGLCSVRPSLRDLPWSATQSGLWPRPVRGPNHSVTLPGPWPRPVQVHDPVCNPAGLWHHPVFDPFYSVAQKHHKSIPAFISNILIYNNTFFIRKKICADCGRIFFVKRGSWPPFMQIYVTPTGVNLKINPIFLFPLKFPSIWMVGMWFYDQK